MKRKGNNELEPITDADITRIKDQIKMILKSGQEHYDLMLKAYQGETKTMKKDMPRTFFISDWIRKRGGEPADYISYMSCIFDKKYGHTKKGVNYFKVTSILGL